MKKFTILFYFSFFTFKLLVSQVVYFDFNTPPYLNATHFQNEVTTSEFSISSGTIGTNKTTSDFADLPYIEATGGWTATSVSSAKYFFINLQAVQGYWMNLTEISFETIVTSAGPSDISVVINDSIVLTLASPLAVDTLQQLLIGFDSLSSVTFKIAGWNNGSRISSGTGAFRIDNFIVNGTVEQIPLKDSTSSVIMGGFEVPLSISSLQNGDNIMKIAEWIFTDSASGDGAATFIDSLKIIPSAFNQLQNWDQFIEHVIMKGPDFPEGLEGVVFTSALCFDTKGDMQIAEGSDFFEVYEIWISLNDSLGNVDNQFLGLDLKANQIFCNPTGSKVGYTAATFPEHSLAIEVLATKATVGFPENVIFTDSLFEIEVRATDVNGNQDFDIGSMAVLSASPGEATLHTNESFYKDFENGKVIFSNLWFTGTDTTILSITTEDFNDQISDSILVGEPIFFDDFETSLSNNWYPTSEWEVTSTAPINGQSSLHHLVSGFAGTSFLTGTYPEPTFNTGKMVWRMVLKNGDFDPTSSNRFWYFLMASQQNLAAPDISGYALGVNLTGSSDTLSLWKLNADGSKQLLLKTNCDWNANDTVTLEVIREVPGIWQVGWVRGNNAKELQFTSKAEETEFDDDTFHGLVYQYSSTRSGQLWADDFNFFRLNTPPVLLTAEAMNSKTIRLNFSEKVQSTEPLSINNIQIVTLTGEEIVPDSMAFDMDTFNRILVYVNRLMTNEYTVQVKNLTDVEGSMMLPQNVRFSYQVPALSGDVVINEILFDPSPVVGLPEYDFLELYNQSENPFYLANWQLKIGEVVKYFPDTVIEKGQYIIVTNSSALTQYQEFGKVIPLLSTTDLTNSAKSILLVSNDGQLIDSLFYQPLWITDENKQEGGWSLERIDPANSCSASANWNASVDSLGGTPGRQNSIVASNMDELPPVIEQISLLSPLEIQLIFSEEIETFTEIEPNQWLVILNGPKIDTIFISEEKTMFHLQLNQPLMADTLYQFNILSFTDLCGNASNDTVLFLQFHIAKPYDLVFNEIMADPTPPEGLPECDYLELYNRSRYVIQLQNWEIVSLTSRKVLPGYILKPSEYLLIYQSGFEEFFSDSVNILGILTSTFLPASGQSLVLKDSAGYVVDSLYYKPSWYHDEEKEDGGWSLERLNVENQCSSLLNWKASENETGGTPGFRNSVTEAFIDSIAPKISEFKIISSHSLSISFTEPVDVIVMANFEWAHHSGSIDSIQLGTADITEVEIFFNQPFESTYTYQLKIAGLHDACGNLMQDTLINFFYYIAKVDDIIFNEIMADPTPAVQLPEVSYIELFNRSSWPIQLLGWKLFYGDYYRELTNFTLQPQDYLILCPVGEASVFSVFGNVMDILSSTTLTSTGKLLQLCDSSGKVINRIDYRKTWYADADKEEGGWSLERIDTENLCSSSFNWRASNSNSGGTPGQKNSIFASNPDQLIPKIQFLKILDEKRIKLEFSKIIPVDILADSSHYLIHGTHLSVESVSDDKYSVVIKRTLPFTEGTTYTVKVAGIADECNNSMKDTLINFIFHTLEPNDLVFTEIFADESPSVGLPEYEYLEVYNRSKKYIDLEGWDLVVGTTTKSLPRKVIAPNTYLILTSSKGAESLDVFGETLSMTSFSTLPNESGFIQLVDTLGAVICQVAYSNDWYHDVDKEDGGWSLEVIDPENVCSGITNWKASIHMSGGTPGVKNSVYSPNIDLQSPEIKTLIPTGIQELFIEFTEFPESNSMLNPLNYFHTELEHPVQITLDSLDSTKILLFFNDSLTPLTHSYLQVSNVEDLCENLLADTLIDFVYFEPINYDLVFNEIMANPEPSQGLPGKEYLEIYNTSEYGIYLYGWVLKVASSERILPYKYLPPHSCSIITDIENYDFFNEFGSVIPVDNLPSLASTGKVYLLNSEGKYICGTEWYSEWITDDFKANGGFSLERIDPQNPNETFDNWKPSESAIGGTPGEENSVYQSNPDLVSPELVRAFPMNDSILRIEFSEPIQKSSFLLNSILINEESGAISQIVSYEPELWYYDLELANPLTFGTIYTISVGKQITDLAGNGILNNEALFAKQGKATANDIIINELLYNPTTSGTDFVELYNRSMNPVNLKQLFLATRNSDSQIDQLKTISNFGVLLFPQEYVVLSTNQQLIKNAYMVKNENAFYDMEVLPSFPDDEGTVVLIDTNGVVIDEFFYNDDMQFGLLQSTEGVSLERIHYNRPTNEPANWHSAAASVGWATPGYQNSVYMEQVTINQEVWVEPELFTPNSDGFNDVVNFHYQFSKPGYVANVTIFNEKGQRIRKVTQNELLAIQGTISWDGLSEDQTKAPMGIYIILFEVFDLEGQLKQYKKVCVSSIID